MKFKYTASILTFILIACASKGVAQNGWITPFLPDSLDNCFYSAGYRNNIHYYAGSFSGHIETTHYAVGGRDMFVFTRNFTNYTTNLIQAGGLGNDEALSLSVDPANGSFYVTGYFSGTAFFGNDTLLSNGLEDIFLAKYNASGMLQWATSFGGSSTDKGLSVQLQGNAVIVAGMYTNAITYDTSGNTITSNGGTDGFLLSASATDGSLNWMQSMGGISNDEAKSVAASSSGDIFVCGFFTNNALFGTANVASSGQSDGFLARYSSAGVLSWVTPVGSMAADTATAVALTSSGSNVCITGSFKDSVFAGPDTVIARGGSDCIVAYLDAATGNVLWARGSGGPGYDAGIGICADNTHMFFNAVTSDTLYFGTSVTSSAGGLDAYTARYDLFGNSGWIKRDNTPSDSELYGIVQSGSYLYTGGYLRDSLGPNVEIVGVIAAGWRLSKSTGLRDQSVTAGGMSSMGAVFDQITIGENKSAYAVGVITGEWMYDNTLLHTTNSAYPNSRGIVKVDSTGTFLWMKEIMPGNSSSSAMPRKVEAIQGGGFVVTGVYTGTVRFSSALTITSPGGQPGVFLARYDATGNVLWAKHALFGNPTPTVSDLAIDANGKIYLIGTFVANPTYVDNSFALYNGVAQTGGYIVRYDSNGLLEWAEGYGSQQNNITIGMSSIEIDRSGNMIFAGGYYGQGGFTDLNITGDNRSFIAKLSPSGTILWTKVIATYSNSVAYNPNHTKCDTSGNIYFYFSFEDSAFISPTVTFTDPGYRDAALVKYDPQGIYQWGIHIAYPNTLNGDHGELQLTGHGEPMVGCTEASNVTYNSVSLGWTPNTTVLHITKFSPLGTIVSDTVLGYGNASMYQFDLSDNYIVVSGVATYSGTTVCGEFIPGYEPYISFTPFFAALYHDTCSRPIAQFSETNNGFGLYTFSPALPATQYVWDFGDGNFDTTALPSHQYTNTGIYTVCLIATNHCGADTFCQQINCAILSVPHEGSLTGITVFPNPTPDVFTIYSTLADAQFVLYDTFGREVTSGTICSTSVCVDLQSEASGIYLLKVIADQKVCWQKIVRQ